MAFRRLERNWQTDKREKKGKAVYRQSYLILKIASGSRKEVRISADLNY